MVSCGAHPLIIRPFFSSNKLSGNHVVFADWSFFTAQMKGTVEASRAFAISASCSSGNLTMLPKETTQRSQVLARKRYRERYHSFDPQILWFDQAIHQKHSSHPQALSDHLGGAEIFDPFRQPNFSGRELKSIDRD
ncbi:hypothetical protein H5410_043126 [Solanum commersonii]|uniref:Uncharacterized protein n=1 Tax=Solanum commersonii TaxID=4109 RepID=A0A9J5XZR0_SOLCO|nr:hypothetical protein H5410_043126 [Solanum commersonii]